MDTNYNYDSTSAATAQPAPAAMMQSNPGHHNPHDAEREKTKGDLCKLVDEICSELTKGSLWHGSSALCMRSDAFRGFGELHERMSCHDHKKKLSLEKISGDRLKHRPRTNLMNAQKDADYTFDTVQHLRNHFDEWIKREKHYEHYINEAVGLARSINALAYEELYCLLKDVQEEITRVEFLIRRLNSGGWSGHDVCYVSELYHKHFENGGSMDITLS